MTSPFWDPYANIQAWRSCPVSGAHSDPPFLIGQSRVQPNECSPLRFGTQGHLFFALAFLLSPSEPSNELCPVASATHALSFRLLPRHCCRLFRGMASMRPCSKAEVISEIGPGNLTGELTGRVAGQPGGPDTGRTGPHRGVSLLVTVASSGLRSLFRIGVASGWARASRMSSACCHASRAA